MEIENIKNDEYIPGTCNIGKEEIKRRRDFAIFSGIFTVLLIILLQWIGATRPWRLFVFIPALSFGVGLLQWLIRFCVNFGMRGVYNFGKVGKTYSIEQQEYLKKDRAKAMGMILIGTLIGIAITVVYFFMPA